MRFAIQDGKPYLISGGKAYPVELTEKHGIKFSKSKGRNTDVTGYLSLEEVYAKFGKTKSDHLHDAPLSEATAAEEMSLSAEPVKVKRTRKTVKPLTED